MRKLIIATALLFLALAPEARAFALIQRINMQPPGWVNHNIYPSVDANFFIQRYWVYGGGYTSPYALSSITRASSKTNLLPSSPSGFAYSTFGNNVLAIDSNNGSLIEEARTNQLLNSTAPATQTTGSLANGTYTLWVNGSGTATMSAGTATGCGTGVASQGTAVNFTTSGAAGTCVVTVAGSLNAFQLEIGGFGTSLIVTAGATATRAADSISAIGVLNTVFNGPSASIVSVASYNGVSGPLPRIFDSNAQNVLFINGGAGGVAGLNYGGATVASTANTLAVLTIGKIGASWKPGAQSVVMNNGSVVNGVGATSAPTLTFIGNRAASDRPLNGYMARLALWNSRISDAALKGFTQ